MTPGGTIVFCRYHKKVTNVSRCQGNAHRQCLDVDLFKSPTEFKNGKVKPSDVCSRGLEYGRVDTISAANLDQQHFEEAIAEALFSRCQDRVESVELKRMMKRHRIVEKYLSAASTYNILGITLLRALKEPMFVKKYCLSSEPPLWIELGVYRGTSINMTTVFLDELDSICASKYGTSINHNVVHGFDTFEGLPEHWWHSFAKGSFSWRTENPGSKYPPLRKRTELHVGLFEDRLEPFLAKHPLSKLMFLNVDNDLFRGADFSLRALTPRFTSGTRLHFHELMHRPVNHYPPSPKNEISGEALALHGLLNRHPCMVLRLDDVARGSLSETAAFTVLTDASGCPAPPTLSPGSAGQSRMPIGKQFPRRAFKSRDTYLKIVEMRDGHWGNEIMTVVLVLVAVRLSYLLRYTSKR